MLWRDVSERRIAPQTIAAGGSHTRDAKLNALLYETEKRNAAFHFQFPAEARVALARRS